MIAFRRCQPPQTRQFQLTYAESLPSPITEALNGLFVAGIDLQPYSVPALRWQADDVRECRAAEPFTGSLRFCL